MKEQRKKRSFMRLKARGSSFEYIAEKLGVPRSTLISWLGELNIEIKKQILSVLLDNYPRAVHSSDIDNHLQNKINWYKDHWISHDRYLINLTFGGLIEEIRIKEIGRDRHVYRITDEGRKRIERENISSKK